jgi:hypothetical protein
MKVGGQLDAPAALPPGKRPGTHCIGDWVGPRTEQESHSTKKLQWQAVLLRVDFLSRPTAVTVREW